MAAQTDAVIARAERHLPNGFPAFISDPVFSSLQKQARKILWCDPVWLISRIQHGKQIGESRMLSACY